MRSLVNEILKFLRYCTQNHSFFSEKNVRSFSNAKAPYPFSAKNVTANDFLSTERLNKSLSNDFVNPVALRKAKTLKSFGLSECNRVKLTRPVTVTGKLA